MMRRFIVSFMLALLLTGFVALFQIPAFLSEKAQNTYYNKQATLSFHVVNKDNATFTAETRRVKFHYHEKVDNSISANSKMTYIPRKRDIELTVDSVQPGYNEIMCRFYAPDMYVGDNKYPAQMLYHNIMIDGKLIQKEVLTSGKNPYEYLLKDISNGQTVSISFSAQKPFSVSDIKLLKSLFFFLVFFLIIMCWKIFRVQFSRFSDRLGNNKFFNKIVRFYQNTFYCFSYWKFILFAFIIMVLFWAVSIETPFHSDDWTQMDDGVSLSKIYHIWTNWSGRLVADTCARGLLQLNNYPVLLSLICACIPVIVCALITFIPSKITGKRPELLTFLLIVFLYWICNPNLGQTTFWIVGMSNYLVTCMMVLLFLYVYISGYQSQKIGYRILLFLLGVCAGCSNEHTALTLPFIILGAGYLLKKQYPRQSLLNTKIGFVSLIFGAVLLIAAPGNFVRLKTETETLSFLRKIGKGTERLFRHFISFDILFILLGISAFYTKTSFKIKQRKPQPFWWAILFVFAGCMAAGVMIISPSASARTFNNSLVFFLLGFSFMLQGLPLQQTFSHLIKFLALTGCFIIFSYSYICILYSYRSTSLQQTIRLSLILQAQKEGLSEVVIPAFYFPKLRSVHDKFDLYHNSVGMGHHFGMEQILLNQDIQFDYGTYLRAKPIQNSPISDIFILRDDSTLFFDGTVLVGTKNPEYHLEKCKVLVNDREYNLPTPIQVKGAYLTGTPVYQLKQNKVELVCPFLENKEETKNFK